eukprot:6122901-Amphidinium_carterae.1
MSCPRADAAVITWGGLRGAVGLALAIQVFNDRAEDLDEFGNPSIDEYEAFLNSACSVGRPW